MGNNRFRFSDMIPNAWFYKLKDMGRGRIHNSNSSSSTTYSSSAAAVKKKQGFSSAGSGSGSGSAAAAALPSKPKHPHHHSYPRKSYHFTRRDLIPTCDQTFFPDSDTHLHDPPRKSSKQKRSKRRSSSNTKSKSLSSSSPKLVTSSVSSGCRCRATLWNHSDSPPDYSASPPSDTSPDSSLELYDSFPPEFRSDRVLPTNDVVINVDKKSLESKVDKQSKVFDEMSDLDLPPIITKPAKFIVDDQVDEDIKKKEENKEPTRHRRSSAKYQDRKEHGSLSVKVAKQQSISTKEHHHKSSSNSVRRNSVTSPGVRLRVNSPKIGSRKIQGRKSVSSMSSSSSSRKSLSDSLAIVKSSFDPKRDFRESMVEMILENNIKASKDLEDLLACYLSLNSDEYHDLIIQVFKQLWFDLTT